MRNIGSSLMRNVSGCGYAVVACVLVFGRAKTSIGVRIDHHHGDGDFRSLFSVSRDAASSIEM